MVTHHKKKSGGFKSGDRNGHSIATRRLMVDLFQIEKKWDYFCGNFHNCFCSFFSSSLLQRFELYIPLSTSGIYSH